jgi:hypothetical protein
VCCAIENLATSLAPHTEDQRYNALTPHFNDLFTALFNVAYRNDGDTGVDLPLASFSALSALTEFCCLDSCAVIYDKLVPLLQQIEATITGNVMSDAKAKQFQDFLAGLLQIMLVKIGSKLDQHTADSIVTLLIMIFDKQKKVTECGLIAYSGLCNGIGAKINVKDFGQYIVWALKGQDDECVRLACGLVSDIADALKEHTGTYMNDFVPPLINILKDNGQDRLTKLQAIVALGDLAMNCSLAFTSNYLQDVLTVLDSAARQSVNTKDFYDDPDILDYLTKLRETLIECYTTIVHGVKQSSLHKPLIDHSPAFFLFLERCVDKSVSPSKSMLKSVLGLVGDMADCVGPQIIPLLKSQFVEQLILALRAANDSDSQEVANWAYKKIKHSLDSA